MKHHQPAAWIPAWVPDAVFYQVFPERFRNGDPANDPPGTEAWGGKPTRENFFGGDLKGITDGLVHMRDLGATALYLNPIFRAGTNHRYDTHDYLAIDPALGTEADFDELVSKAHSLGIRIVLDGVFNHCGLDFGPFKDVILHGADSRYRDWFDIYDFPVRTGLGPGMTGFPGYAVEYKGGESEVTPPNYATCGLAAYLPRLNTANPDVEAFIHKVSLYWLERGIDGWRLDVPYEIDTSFWRRFRTAIKARYPDAYLVAEEWRSPNEFLGGDTFDGATHYGVRGLVLDFLARRALTGEAFLRALHNLQESLPQGTAPGMLNLLGSHDTPRILTELDGNSRLLNLAFTCLFTLPGAPLIYYGDEVGLTGSDDPDCRRTMPWDPAEWNGDILARVKRLVELRHRMGSLRHGELTPVWGNDRVACFERRAGHERALIVLNSSQVRRPLAVPVDAPDGSEFTDRLRGETFRVEGGHLGFDVAEPERAWVLVPEP